MTPPEPGAYGSTSQEAPVSSTAGSEPHDRSRGKVLVWMEQNFRGCSTKEALESLVEQGVIASSPRLEAGWSSTTQEEGIGNKQAEGRASWLRHRAKRQRRRGRDGARQTLCSQCGSIRRRGIWSEAAPRNGKQRRRHDVSPPPSYTTLPETGSATPYGPSTASMMSPSEIVEHVTRAIQSDRQQVVPEDSPSPVSAHRSLLASGTPSNTKTPRNSKVMGLLKSFLSLARRIIGPSSSARDQKKHRSRKRSKERRKPSKKTRRRSEGLKTTNRRPTAPWPPNSKRPPRREIPAIPQRPWGKPGQPGPVRLSSVSSSLSESLSPPPRRPKYRRPPRSPRPLSKSRRPSILTLVLAPPPSSPSPASSKSPRSRPQSKPRSSSRPASLTSGKSAKTPISAQKTTPVSPEPAETLPAPQTNSPSSAKPPIARTAKQHIAKAPLLRLRLRQPPNPASPRATPLVSKGPLSQQQQPPAPQTRIASTPKAASPLASPPRSPLKPEPAENESIQKLQKITLAPQLQTSVSPKPDPEAQQMTSKPLYSQRSLNSEPDLALANGSALQRQQTLHQQPAKLQVVQQKQSAQRQPQQQIPLQQLPAPQKRLPPPLSPLIPKPLPQQQPRNITNSPWPAPALARQHLAPQPQHIARKPVNVPPAPAPAPVLAVAAPLSVLARDLGDNTRTYLPGVREISGVVGQQNNASNATPGGLLVAVAAAAVAVAPPTVLGRDLGDNTRTYLPGVWEVEGNNASATQGRERAPAAAPTAPASVLNRSIGDMSRTYMPGVRDVDGAAEYDADLDVDILTGSKSR